MTKFSQAPVLLSGKWQPSLCPTGAFRAVNPATGKELSEEFPISSWADLETALSSGVQAALRLGKISPEKISEFLRIFADLLTARKSDIVETANLETGLSIEPRLASSEFPRLIDQVRQTAEACLDRTWCRAIIDTKRNLRLKYGPLGGPVAVFSPNNFPLAYNAVGGGDFVAAIASGNPVISKANPCHPGTTRLLAEAAHEAVVAAGLPEATFQLVYHFSVEDGFRLVAHHLLAATSFTGSRQAGLALKRAAEAAGRLIYLEMSSSNPVFILPGALAERSSQIAAELFNSCTLAQGQLCTRPGLVILIKGQLSENFILACRQIFKSEIPGYVLSRKILSDLEACVRNLKQNGAHLLEGGQTLAGPGFRFAPTLFLADGIMFLKNPASFGTEIFGPLTVLIQTSDFKQMTELAAALEGQLTASIYSHTDGSDDELYLELEPLVRTKVGRLLNDKMPTGVVVSPAMNHGGPFPATAHPGFTSVGIPNSMLRFAALHCYDNIRPDRLPPELQDKNPDGRMWRFIDGEWTKQNV